MSTRQQLLDDARKLINWLEEHPNVPLPNEMNGCGEVSIFSLNTKDEAVMLTKEFGTCDKGIIDTLFTLSKKFGSQTLRAVFLRDVVCERVVVAIEDVPEQVIPETVSPAHTREIVEWKCSPILAATEKASEGVSA